MWEGQLLSKMYVFLQRGETALHVACSDGNVSIVEMLLNRGADIAIQNKVAVVCTSCEILHSMITTYMAAIIASVIALHFAIISEKNE